MYKLREYQQELISNIKIALQKHNKIVAVAPCRAGKTIVFSHIAKKMEDAGKRVLILTHRKEIFDQTFEKLCSYGINPGQIRTGKEITKNLVQVGMVQTVLNLIKKQNRIQETMPNFKLIEEPDIMLPDEFHHICASTWSDVVTFFPKAIMIGFTASPIRLDGKGLIDHASCIVSGKSTKWMIDNYFLSRPIHLCPKSPLDAKKIKKVRGDYDKESQTKEMTKSIVVGNVVDLYKQYFNGAQIIVYCCSIKHCEVMEKAYSVAGWKPVIIEGRYTHKKRTEIMDDFRDGKYNQLISVDLLGEGIDCQGVFGIQVLRKTASLSKYIQMFSRGLTPVYVDGYDLENIEQRKIALQKGKPESVILDHVGNYFEHGAIDKSHEWSLDHKKRNEKTTIAKKECPECHFSWELNIKICPACGHDFVKASEIEKEHAMIELQEELVNVADIGSQQAGELAGVINRIKEYSKNKNNAMFAEMHKSVNKGETGLQEKLKALCHGLGYNEYYHHRVWQYLRDSYGDKMDELQ
jgi:superfamily II DNA or RNA helicase